ncbi:MULTISPECIES: branched-chain amino acid transport system II carrier protein [Cetobacterium]|jgi:LIVCS family branched-chain amino acid:cation transporter|uniref:Branched-chain amino acid transport system II carrier protein n=1 Tax=Candidatus Cetobacterium colombiensis TaxID=3073100 RepID=A0ABU4W9S5_9FUSO|nr:branched-chain amino acid transport system II carrier protein [Candidatus Cetobacterium colombiensis]MDX8336282.1 branched-chain amino acid transport system II carrier protein [Candidatus Cetobacterium colombiensis]
MNKKKEILILGFALFSMFFGAGNLLFPPSVGVAVGKDWFQAGLGFFLTGIGLPLLGILAFTKVGSLDDFANKVSNKFNTIYSTILILVIGPLFAIPRTGSTTFEMGVLPLFPNSNPTVLAIATSVIFFGITLFLVLNESSITDILGKFLTPIILLILSLITILGITSDLGTPVDSVINSNPFSYGFVSGYQTMDALASVLFGVIIIRGLEGKGINNKNEQKMFLSNAGFIAAIGLGFIYLSLIYLGAQISSIKGLTTAQTTLTLAQMTLGNIGKVAFGICVAAACLTTSVGLVALASEWFSKLTKISYKKIALGICIFSTVLSVAGLDYLISLSIPVLVILYPITIVLILLNIFGIKSVLTFRIVVITTFIISIAETLKVNLDFIPLAKAGFPWILPACIAFGISFILKKIEVKKTV